MSASVWGAEWRIIATFHQWGLSPREAETMLLALAGMSVKETADTMFIEPITVKIHRREAYRKAGISVYQPCKVIAFGRQLMEAQLAQRMTELRSIA